MHNKGTWHDFHFALSATWYSVGFRCINLREDAYKFTKHKIIIDLCTPVAFYKWVFNKGQLYFHLQLCICSATTVSEVLQEYSHQMTL